MMVKNSDSLQREMNRLDVVISGKYLGDNSPIPAEQMHIAYMWLENDISSSLYKAEDMDAAMDEITSILKTSPMYEEIVGCISLDKAYKRADIRKDFAGALSSVKQGSELSGILGWSFSDNDLKILAGLHKSNKYRKKIENLLTDCNFHYACALMSSKNYASFL